MTQEIVCIQRRQKAREHIIETFGWEIIDGGLFTLFYRGPNGITIHCDAALVGETGEVDGITYTKLDRDGVISLIVAGNYGALETTCTSGITEMNAMFQSVGDFDHDISHWDVSSVTDMREMFNSALIFNQDLSGWDTGSVTNMYRMFGSAGSFGQDVDLDLSGWDVSNVTNFREMFSGATSFTSDLSSWNITTDGNFQGMFEDANSFTSNLGVWDISNITNTNAIRNMLNNSGLTVQDYDQTLIGWAELDNVPSGIKNFGVNGLMFCAAVEARNFLEESKEWDIDGDIKCSSLEFSQLYPRDGGSDVAPDSIITVEFRSDLMNWDTDGITITASDGEVVNGISDEIGATNDNITWSFTTKVATSTELADEPLEFSLLQNYPNPFNPTTQIQFGLPQATHVQLEVFNMIGQQVSILVNNRLPAGFHIIPFNASNLSSGVYIYRITAGKYVETRKMLLLK